MADGANVPMVVALRKKLDPAGPGKRRRTQSDAEIRTEVGSFRDDGRALA